MKKLLSLISAFLLFLYSLSLGFFINLNYIQKDNYSNEEYTTYQTFSKENISTRAEHSSSSNYTGWTLLYYIGSNIIWPDEFKTNLKRSIINNSKNIISDKDLTSMESDENFEYFLNFTTAGILTNSRYGFTNSFEYLAEAFSYWVVLEDSRKNIFWDILDDYFIYILPEMRKLYIKDSTWNLKEMFDSIDNINSLNKYSTIELASLDPDNFFDSGYVSPVVSDVVVTKSFETFLGNWIQGLNFSDYRQFLKTNLNKTQIATITKNMQFNLLNRVISTFSKKTKRQFRNTYSTFDELDASYEKASTIPTIDEPRVMFKKSIESAINFWNVKYNNGDVPYYIADEQLNVVKMNLLNAINYSEDLIDDAPKFFEFYLHDFEVFSDKPNNMGSSLGMANTFRDSGSSIKVNEPLTVLDNGVNLYYSTSYVNYWTNRNSLFSTLIHEFGHILTYVLNFPAERWKHFVNFENHQKGLNYIMNQYKDWGKRFNYETPFVEKVENKRMDEYLDLNKFKLPDLLLSEGSKKDIYNNIWNYIINFFENNISMYFSRDLRLDKIQRRLIIYGEDNNRLDISKTLDDLLKSQHDQNQKKFNITILPDVANPILGRASLVVYNIQESIFPTPTPESLEYDPKGFLIVIYTLIGITSATVLTAIISSIFTIRKKT